MRNHFLRAAAGNTGLASGQYFPMFAIKLFDAGRTTGSSANPPTLNTSDCEIPMRRALSFDTGNTTELTGSETMSEIVSILDTSKYTCNSQFKNLNINGIKIEHWQNSSTKYNDAEVTFNGTGFNIYDHACNTGANLFVVNTNNFPSQIGDITALYLDGASESHTGSKFFVNHSTATATAGTGGWQADTGDYCFLGISDKAHNTAANDTLDKEFATSKGLAFGISDSNGGDVVGGVQQTPREGISRRNDAYDSLFTNWQQKLSLSSNAHSGNTVSGYAIVRGKVI